MKVTLASVLFCAILAPAARADVSFGVYADIPGQPIDSVDEFYGELQPYGSWVQDPQLGLVFIPSQEGYVPYTNGHWEYTDIGLVWISDEPFAWATSHYGRWFFDDAYDRWAWMPDTQWGPSWVQWSEYGNDYGWAPLPPRGYELPDVAWNYAPADRLFDPDLHRYYEPRRRAIDIHRYARNVPQYRQYENRQIVAGPPVNALQQHHVAVQPHRLEARQVGRFAPGQQPRPQPNVQARSPRDFQNRPQVQRTQPQPRTVEPARRPQIENRPQVQRTQPQPRTVEPAQRPQFENRPQVQRVQPPPVQRPQPQPQMQPRPQPQPQPHAQMQPRPQPQPQPHAQMQPRPQPPMHIAPPAQARPAPQAAQHAAPAAQQHAAPQAPPAQQHAAPAPHPQASSDRRDRERH